MPFEIQRRHHIKPGSLLFSICCCCCYYFQKHVVYMQSSLMVEHANAKMSKQIINKVTYFFFIPPPPTPLPLSNLLFHIAQRTLLNPIYLLFYSQFPVDDFLVNFCAVLFVHEMSETHTHTHAVFLDRQNIFR